MTRSVQIKDSAASVWNLVTTPGVLIDCHPFCKDNQVKRWPGVGSQDTIEYYSGLTLVRDFTKWIEGVGFDLTARDDQGGDWQVSWRITSEDEHFCQLAISIMPNLADLSTKKEEQLARLLGRYLEQVLEGINFYLETGTAVRRNQFGSHPMFSPAVKAEKGL